MTRKQRRNNKRKTQYIHGGWRNVARWNHQFLTTLTDGKLNRFDRFNLGLTIDI